jgi:hypothetical protein
MGIVMYYSEPDYSWVPLVMIVVALVGLVVGYFIIKAAVRNGINESRLFVKSSGPETVPDKPVKTAEAETVKPDAVDGEGNSSTIWPR